LFVGERNRGVQEVLIGARRQQIQVLTVVPLMFIV
jgi:hypothetical protein